METENLDEDTNESIQDSGKPVNHKKKQHDDREKYNLLLSQFLSDEKEQEIKLFIPAAARKLIHGLIEHQYPQLSSLSIGKGLQRCMVISKKGKLRLKPEDLNLRSRVVIARNYHLPIPEKGLKSPYFTYFIDLYDPLLGTRSIVQSFIDFCEIEGESAITKSIDTIRMKICNSIEKSSAWEEFDRKAQLPAIGTEGNVWSPEEAAEWETVTNTVSQRVIGEPRAEWYTTPKPEKAVSLDQLGSDKLQENKDSSPIGRKFQQCNVYWPKYHNCYFVSIDLRAANFNALRQFDSSLVNNSQTWEEFITRFTNSKYLINSKKFRLITLSKLHGKFQALLWENITYRVHTLEFLQPFQIYKSLISSGIVKLDQLCGVASDELIFIAKHEDLSSLVPLSREWINNNLTKYASFVKVEAFHLKQLVPSKPTSPWFVKQIFFNDSLTDRTKFKAQIKGAHASVFAQCYKHYMGLPLHDYDLLMTGGMNAIETYQ